MWVRLLLGVQYCQLKLINRGLILEEKVCTRCKQIFLVTSKYFTFDKRNKNGLQSECRYCHIKRNKDYARRNKDKIKEYKKNYYKENIDRIKKRQKEYSEKNKDKRIKHQSTPKYKFNAYWNGAKARNIFWGLSLEQFIEFWQKPCIYCGDSIKTIGLDRINNNLGYIKDNIVSCCEVCNRMKMKYTVEEFINKCRKITKKFTFSSLINKQNGKRTTTKKNV